MKWTIVVPLKALPAAKSRLASASGDPQQHAALVEAIRADTLEVAASVGRVLIVVDRPTEPAETTEPTETTAEIGEPGPSDVVVLVQTEAGLNAALREAAEYARAHWPDDGIAALVGDLPALRAGELAGALDLAAEHPRSYVADDSGTGTTLLAAAPGVDLSPAFGVGSAARHEQIAHHLPVGPGLRLDVDTAGDLERAIDAGVGPATKALLGR